MPAVIISFLILFDFLFFLLTLSTTSTTSDDDDDDTGSADDNVTGGTDDDIGAEYGINSLPLMEIDSLLSIESSF